jgi:hypothetical protein
MKKTSFLIKSAVLICLAILALTFVASTAHSAVVYDGTVSVSVKAPSAVIAGEKFDVKMSVNGDTSKVYAALGKLYLDDTAIATYWIFLDTSGNWKNTLADQTLSAGTYNYKLVVTYYPSGGGSKTLSVTSEDVIVSEPYDLEFELPSSAKETQKPGRTIPIKFSVEDDGVFIKDQSVKVVISQGTTTVFTATYPTVTIQGKKQYHVNWDSDKDASGDFLITVSFSNGFKTTTTITLK